MKETVQGYYIEAKWILEGNSPSFEVYIKNGLTTSTNAMLSSTSLLGIKSATKEAFEWLKSDPKIVIASSTIFRLVNDMSSYESNKKKGQITSGVDYYMNEYGVTKMEAMYELKKLVENAWKDLNACCLRPVAASAEILIRILNLTRIIEAAYKKNQDGFNDPRSSVKAQIISLLVDSFEI